MRKIILACALISIPTQGFAQPVPLQKPSPQIITVTQIESPKESVIDHQDSLLFTSTARKSKSDKPLTIKDAELYREIYTLQSKNQFDQADRLIKRIDNPILLGHILAQRLINKDYGATNAEMERWLELYPGHPQSVTIEGILGTHGHSIYKNRAAGTMDELRYFANGSKFISDIYKGKQRTMVNSVKKEIDASLARGHATAALDYFNKNDVQRYIDPVDRSQILSRIASVYLYLGYPDKAKSTAMKAMKASKDTPVPGWILGLTAWISGDFKTATHYFTLASEAKYASPWMTSAASYWGARAATRAKLYPQVSPLLAKAVKHQRTFYGLIATKALGYGYDFNWTMPEYTPKMRNILLQYPSGARAVALADLDQFIMAEAELFNLPVKTHPDLQAAALSLAHHYNLAGYAMRFSSALPNPAGGYYDAGLYPQSIWTKQIEGEDVALMNAFIRQESRFIATAHNPTGATGLMQIMPQTAAYMTDDPDYKGANGSNLLKNPRRNVKIGISYLDHLLSLQVVSDDLFGLAMAYNAGPGKLARWKQNIKVEDPLLFIELIPASETRAFVERVATNYWIYQMQMGVEPETLTAVASGDWPKMN